MARRSRSLASISWSMPMSHFRVDGLKWCGHIPCPEWVTRALLFLNHEWQFSHCSAHCDKRCVDMMCRLPNYQRRGSRWKIGKRDVLDHRNTGKRSSRACRVIAHIKNLWIALPVRTAVVYIADHRLFLWWWRPRGIQRLIRRRLE